MYLLKQTLKNTVQYLKLGLKMESKGRPIGAMHCGIDCSRSGTTMPDLDPFQIWNFARTGNRLSANVPDIDRFARSTQ